MFLSFVFECLLKSSKFANAPVDNKIALLSFILKTRNNFWSLCSIYDTANKLLNILQIQDICSFTSQENVIPNVTKDNNTNFQAQLDLIKQKFQYDKSKKNGIIFIPVRIINKSKGQIIGSSSEHTNNKSDNSFLNINSDNTDIVHNDWIMQTN